MRRIKITFLLCLILDIALAQSTYFNTRYDFFLMNKWDVSKSLLETENGYLIGGMTSGINENWYRISISKLDIYGNEEWTNTWGANDSQYWLGDPGSFIHTDDGGYIMCGTLKNNIVMDAGLIIKLDENCDTTYTRIIWDEDIPVVFYYYLFQCIETDNGFVFIGSNSDVNNSYHNNIYLLKTDKVGNKIFDSLYTYPNSMFKLRGNSVIETPDKGFAIGAYRFKSGYTYTGEPMIYKVDSLGNEEWDMDIGGPYYDSKTLLCNAHDGNIMSASCYADSMQGNDNAYRTINIKKIDLEGNIVWDKRYGPSNQRKYIGNIRPVPGGGYIVTGTLFTADQYYPNPWLSGWMLRIDNEGDSLWFRQYHNTSGTYDMDFLYDVIPTSDNGFAACGEVSGEVTNNMQHAWVIKVDSMGCDTPGCATGVFIEELFPYVRDQGEELRLWPNPAKDQVTLSLSKCAASREKAGIISIYDPQGIKVEEIKIPKNTESLEVDVSKYHQGIYYLQYVRSGKIIGTVKFIKG